MSNLILSKSNQTNVVSADTKTIKQALPLRVGTAFSGIGAAEQALSNLKIAHSNEFIVEWCERAKSVFLSNFSVKKVFNDITKIDISKVPTTDLYVYTPSCIDFSSSGLQKGFNGKSGKLVFDAIKIIKATRPSFLLYENVSQLAFKFKKSLDIILNELTNLGYKNQWKILNSRDYGVAQNRSRIYIVSIRDDIDQTFEFPEAYPSKVSINDIMVPTDYTKYLYNEPNIVKFVTKRATDLIKLYTIPRLKQNTDSKIYSTDGVSPTLRTGCKAHFYDTKNKLFRYLTLEERVALQGFPKDFNWNGTKKTQQIKMLGNSVSVPVYEAILKNLLPQYLPTAPKVSSKAAASITNTSTPAKTTSLLQTIKEKERYVSGPSITKDIKAIRKVATDRTTEIIKANIDRPLLSKNMYINQALVNYSKDQDIFDSIEEMDTKELTTYLKDRDLNLYNYDSFADDSDTKKLVLFPYAGGKQGVNKSKMQSLLGNAFKNKKYTKFIDAFAGGFGATYNILPILLEQKIEEIVVNDINKSIINVYRQVQKKPKQVQRNLASISLDYYKKFGKFSPETREEARAQHNELETEFKELEIKKKMTARRAALFLYLMHKSTGGMLDYDMKTKTCFFETSYKIINIDLLINKVQLFHKILNSKKFTFKSVQYKTLFKKYKNDTNALMLIDPPYIEYQEEAVTTKGCSFTYGIDFNQQELLNKVKNLKCDFIYYNNHNPLIENFSKEQNYNYLKNSRSFSNNSEDRTKSVEICMTKFTPENKAINHTAANSDIYTRQAAKATCASSISIFSDCYKKIDAYNQSHQNNKNGVVFTSATIAKEMIKKLNPMLDETIFEPAVGSGVFIIALLEFIVEKYNTTPVQLKSYLEDKVSFADIDKGSVDFTIQLIEDFMLENYQVSNLFLNAEVKDSLVNFTFRGMQLTIHYDIILGNPPYIRTKHIAKDYLIFLRENFDSCKKGNIDIYYAFIEFANKYSTRSSLIVPNSYLTNVSAKRLREIIKPNVSYIRDFKESKQFTASTYTSILMLNKKTTDLFSYTKYDEEASLFNREILDDDTWHIDTYKQSKKYKDRDTKLSDIADIYSGINTNADKLFLIDKSTLENGYYKKVSAGQEFLIEKDMCVDLIKISKRFSSNANQAIIFPYTYINSIIEEKVLATNYPQAYLYLQAIKPELLQRDNSNTGKYDTWYAYGRRQGFNIDFTTKKCFLVPIVYRKDKFVYEQYRPLKRFIHTSGFVIVPKYGYQKQVIEILKSSDFLEYLEINGKTMPGADVNFNRISATTLKNYPYLSTKSVSYAA